MAKYVSGNGGWIFLSDDGITHIKLDVATWTLNRGKRLAEITHSGSEGSAAYKSVVKDVSWRLEFPWSPDDAVLALLGRIQRAEFVYIFFKYGASDKDADYLAETTVESYEVVDNNASDVVRSVLTGKGGRFSSPYEPA